MEMSPNERPYDVIIIGGGPAGAAAGMTLARHGLRSVILEKSRHPRFHIGESLLPRNYTLLQEFGLEKKLADVPHVPKYGAEFGMGGGTGTSLFHFDSGFTQNQQTFNVERALFDKMLLDSARDDGAEVREDVAVKQILKLEDGDVRVALDTGEELSAKWLFDASGQSTVVGRHLNLRRPPGERHLQKVAYFSHFEEVKRHPGRDEGHPLIVMCDEGWFWVIHINDRVTSIGLVMDAELARGTGVPADRMLLWGMQRCPLIRDRCQGATGPTTNQTIANFSYRCEPFAGPGYFLLGDAAAFVDPIFSTGVCLAMMEARRAADHVKMMLHGNLTPAAARRDYVSFAKRSTGIYFGMIRNFYRHSFRELFLNGTGPYQVHKAVLSVLAGHVFPRPKWRLVWRNWLFKAFVQINTKFQLVPKRPTHSLLQAEPMPVGRIGAGEAAAAPAKPETLRVPATTSEPATAGVE
jgi:flavin-dependent dehydrogenase